MRILSFFKKPHRILLAGIALYIIILSCACHAKYLNYNYADFDLAIHSQSVWNITHGSTESSILGIPFLGNHMVIILFLLAPFYALFSTPLLLLYTQTLILAAGAWFIYLIAKKELPEWWSIAFGILYLIYPPLIYMNLYEFHPIALASTFLLGMLYFYKNEKFWPFAIFLTLALFCQENVSLIAIAFSFYVLFDKKRGRWFYTPLTAGILYFILAVFVIMPRLNDAVQFTKLYGHLGGSLPEVFKNIILHPIFVFKIMFSAGKIQFINALFSPLAYLSILSPLNLVPTIPIFLQRLLSARMSEASIAYHYQAEFIPFIFIASIYGAKRLLNIKQRTVKPALIAGLTVLSLTAILASNIIPVLTKNITAKNKQEYTQVLDLIPEDASVIATFDMLPKLANRKNLYSLHHIYSGFYTLSDKPYPTPDADYLLINTIDSLTFSSIGFYGPENYKNLQTLLAEPGWKLLDQINNILVFKKSKDATEKEIDLTKEVADPQHIIKTITQPINTNLELIGFNISIPDKNNTSSLTLYWGKKAFSEKDHNMIIEITSGEMTYQGALVPGSRISPAQSWEPGKIIADKHRIRFAGNNFDPDNVQLSIDTLKL